MLSEMGSDGTQPVEVQEYDEELRVVADVPEASKEEIDVQCDGRVLAIAIAHDPRPVVKRVDLPAYVDADSLAANFNNGILEITLDSEPDPADIGFH